MEGKERAKKRPKHYKRIIVYLLIAFVIIFIGLIIIGSLIPEVNITQIHLIITSPESVNVTELPGFVQAANSIENYSISISNPNFYNMTLKNFSLSTSNFTLVGINPKPPFIIKPNSTENFILEIKLPNHAYNGSLDLGENYIIDHIYYTYNTHSQLNLTNNKSVIIIKATTDSFSNLSILTVSQYNNFTMNKPYSAVYSRNINSSSILLINNLTKGSYYVLMQSNSSNYTYNTEIFTPNQFKILNGSGKLNFYLNNISMVNFTYASTSPSQIYLLNNNESISLINITKENLSNIWLQNIYYNRGDYTELVKSKNGTTLVAINVTPELVNPFYYLYQNKSAGALPVGIASYGLSNILNSSPRAYQVNTQEIVGIANISALKAYNASPPANVSKSGASLQLNVVMNGYNDKGKELTYWLQDVVSFNTSNNNFYFADNIWNFSLPRANMTKVYGKGNLSKSNYTTYYEKFYGYNYPTYYINYSLPFSVKLIILTSGNKISFGYQILKNNYCNLYPNTFTCRDMYLNATPQSEIFYDNVTIPNLSNYSILITPYYKTPGTLTNGSNYYDAELIFGGESNGENTTFSSMNATLQLFYNNSATLTAFPTYYTFGRDTGEGAYNLYTIIRNATGYVTVGNINPLANVNSDYNFSYLQQNPVLK